MDDPVPGAKSKPRGVNQAPKEAESTPTTNIRQKARAFATQLRRASAESLPAAVPGRPILHASQRIKPES
jgi:hypothetical protein